MIQFIAGGYLRDASLLVIHYLTIFHQTVVRCESESEPEVMTEAAEEGGELGIVGDDAQAFSDGNFSPAPGVETICVFPKNGARCEKNFF